MYEKYLRLKYLKTRIVRNGQKSKDLFVRNVSPQLWQRDMARDFRTSISGIPKF